MTQVVHLRTDRQRELAKSLIDKAPDNAVVKISPEKRSDDQNAKMWAMLSDVSRSKPEARRHTPEVWKCLFMQACGHEVTFEHGLDGRPFPLGFHSSKLTKAQMSDLIEFIYSYGAKHGVLWSDYYE
jgi:hypothetical protein